MSRPPMNMDSLKFVLELYQQGLGIKPISRQLKISKNTVKKYIREYEEKKHLMTKSSPSALLPKTESLKLLYNPDRDISRSTRYPALVEHLEYAEKELTKPHVTKQLLYAEYCEKQENPYSYSQYCEYFSEYVNSSKISYLKEYKMGYYIDVDFAGHKLSYWNTDGGEVPCQVFVAVLPWSNKIYCQAVPSQKTFDFCQCIVSMLEFYGGVPLFLLCDNLRTAVTRSDRYSPTFTVLCQMLNDHYGCLFDATRPAKPKEYVNKIIMQTL